MSAGCRLICRWVRLPHAARSPASIVKPMKRSTTSLARRSRVQARPTSLGGWSANVRTRRRPLADASRSTSTARRGTRPQPRPAPGERQHRAVVGEPGDDSELCAGCRQRPFDEALRPAPLVGDDRQLRKILGGHRTPEARERVIMAHDDRPRVTEHLDRLELGLGDRQRARRRRPARRRASRSTRRSMSASSLSDVTTGTGSCRRRRKSPGRSVWETLWNVPIRRTGAPSSRALIKSARAALSRALITFAWSSRSCPSGVIATLREPRNRVTSRAPTRRSSVAICPLIADWL